jgi:hypothetical protein
MRYRRGRPCKTKTRTRSSAVLLLCAATAIPSCAQTLTTLVNFSGRAADPTAPLIEGTDGNLYGTTGGITANQSQGLTGTIFKVTLAGTLTILHSFSGTDGAAPGGLMQGTPANIGPPGSSRRAGGSSSVLRPTRARVSSILRSGPL